MILAQTTETVPSVLTFVNLGALGIICYLFLTGRIFSVSTVEDLRTRLASADKRIESETADSKAVRDAIIHDVAPSMAKMAEREREMVELTTQLLAWAAAQEKRNG